MKSHAGKAVVRWVLLLFLLAGVLTAGLWMYRQWFLSRVEVTEAVKAPVVEAFYATGTLLPDHEYAVRSSVDGVITKMLVDKGDVVAKDQLLAHVRADDYLMKFRQAQADFDLAQKLADDQTSPKLMEIDARLAAALEQLEVSRRERDRISAMLAEQAASTADMDRIIRQLQDDISLTESLKKLRTTRSLELQRDLEVAQAALEIAQWNLDRQDVRSPTEGVVLDRPISEGTRVKINDHLMQVADVRPDQLVMRAAVDEEDKTRLHIGQRVILTLYAYPGQPFAGEVKTIYPQADQELRTFEVDITVTNPDDRFSAGMTGELAFIVAEKESGLVIPSQAVQGDRLWVVEDGRARSVKVEVGLRSVDRTEILSGLSENQRVIISPNQDLTDNQRVTARYVAPTLAVAENKPTQADDSFKGFR